MYHVEAPEVGRGPMGIDELGIEQGRIDIKHDYLARWHHGVKRRLRQNTWLLNMDVRSRRWWNDRLYDKIHQCWLARTDSKRFYFAGSLVQTRSFTEASRGFRSSGGTP